ncbi:hypothetical protein HKX48_001817, partial [Thoreauomyces humboldtii]
TRTEEGDDDDDDDDVPVSGMQQQQQQQQQAATLHLAGTITVALCGSVVIYVLGDEDMPYIDALYWSATAQFVVGLAPANIQSLSRGGQITMFILALFGSPVFMSLVPVLIRRRAFKTALDKEFGVTRTGKLRRKAGGEHDELDMSDFAIIPEHVEEHGDDIYEEFSNQDDLDDGDGDAKKDGTGDVKSLHIRNSKSSTNDPASGHEKSATTLGGPGSDVRSIVSPSATSNPPLREGGPQIRNSRETGPRLRRTSFREAGHDASQSTIQWGHATAADMVRSLLQLLGMFALRPSEAGSLLRPDRHVMEQVGGVEYRALQALEVLIPAFYFGTQFLFFLIIRIYLLFRPSLTTHISSIVSVWWFSAFNAVSTLNQVGITLLDDGMTQFGNEPVLLALLCIPLVIGNTGFAAVMRAMIAGLEWVARKRGDENSARVYRYLLKYPRRCFTYLFDRRQTLLLVGSLVFLNLLQFFCSLALDINDVAFKGVSRFVHFFQSIATRNGGFQIVPFANLHPAMLWVYVGMMYLSSTYPVSVTIRSTTNASYDQRNLGRDSNTNTTTKKNQTPPDAHRRAGNSVMQMRRLMLNDILVIFLIIFLILVFENSNVERQWPDPERDGTNSFTLFALVFEVVSAYGNVG